MAIASMCDFPNLDGLLNAAEDRNCSIHHPSVSETGTFDPNEFAGIVKLYHEQSKTMRQHYEIHMENQQKELFKQNEASLLDSLEQTKQNFESDHMAEFASLSSTLVLDADVNKPCMLKEILMSPYSDRYSREVNSPEHASKDIITYGNSSPCPPGQSDSNSVRPKSTKQSKRYPELMKHMASPYEHEKSTQSTSKLGGTRLVSSRQYMNKYGSPSTIDSPQVVMTAGKTESLTKRVLVRPVSVTGKKDGSRRRTLTLELKSSTAAKILDNKSKVVVQKSSSASAGTNSSKVKVPSVGNISENIKRPHSASDYPPAKKICMNVGSSDHDYCTEQIVHSPVQKMSDGAKEPEKSSQKVVKWGDFVQRNRSTPKSPTTAPRVSKGLGRQTNNFMVVSLQNSHMPTKVLVNSLAGKDKPQTSVPLPLPLQKNTVKTSFELQEFNKYMTGLKVNLNSPKSVSPSQESETSGSESMASKSGSASQSLAALVQQHQRNSTTTKAHSTSPRSNNAGTTCTNSNKDTSTLKTASLTGSSGQLLMVKVPRSSSSNAAKAVTSSSSTPPTQSPVISQTELCQSQNESPQKNDQGNYVVKTTLGKECDEKSEDQSNTPKSPVKGNLKIDAPSSSPTFKLMSCAKDGGEGMSLYLSGVSGTLKDVLTKLAEQQAKAKVDGNNTGIGSDEQQISILQNLISCLKSQPKTTSDANTAQNTTNTNEISSSNISLVDSVSVPNENRRDQTHTQEVTTSTMGSVGENNQTVTIPKTSVVEDCDVVGVQSNHPPPVSYINDAPIQSSTATLTNGTTEPEMSSFNAHGISENSIKTEQVSHFQLGSDILASAISQTCNIETPILLDDGGRLAGMEGQTLFPKPGVNEPGQSNSNLLTNDHDPAVITLEEALLELNDDDDETNCKSNQPADVSLPSNENLFCKLPSYYMNGKLLAEGRQKGMEGITYQKLKHSSSDPLISIKKEDEAEFNKLPHYFSSGKTSLEQSLSTDEISSKKRKKSKGYAVKLNHVGDTQHLTPEGVPVDTSQIYYSRLPSYYSYGRPHLPVKTFNDEAADAKDDTVTQETLESERCNSKSEKRSKKKKSKKKKKRKSKHDDKHDVDEVSTKILYSKLPSYYMSSKDKNELLSPARSPRSRYRNMSRSPSYSSRGSRSRSRSYSRSPRRDSRSRRRYRSRSYSRSPSCSRDSDHNSRRSWRHDRGSAKSRSGRSFDRRSYDSTDEDIDDCRRQREREVHKSKRQLDKQKKENQARKERRIVFVGGIENNISKHELRKKFARFGNIENVSVFFRNDKENYGFVTFQYACDAIRAFEEGASLAPEGTQYEVNFGDRRGFCRTDYYDLDGNVLPSKGGEVDFDSFLANEMAKRRLRH